MKKSVFLTGATGFVGKRLLHDLVEKGHYVYALVRNKNGVSSDERLKQLVTSQYAPQVTLVEGDLMQEGGGIVAERLASMQNKIDLLIHSGAVVHFDDKYQEQHLKTNIEGTQRMLETAKRLGVPQFYHISTAYTVGKAQEAREELHPVDGEFQNSYERSKCLTEHYVMEAANDKMQVAIFRPSIIIGDSKTGQAETDISVYGFLLTLLRFIERVGKETTTSYRVKANPNVGMNIVPLDLVCDALVLAMEDGVKSGIFNITSPQTVPVPVFMSTIARNLGMPENFLVPTKDLPKAEMSKDEQFLNRISQTFHPYFTHGPNFHNDNTRKLFERRKHPYATMDAKMFDFIIRTFTKQHVKELVHV